MAQPIPAPAPAAAQFANPLPIIGNQYCEPYPVDLSVVRKDKFMSPGNLSKEPRDLIFTVNKGSVSMFQRKAKVHVFSANNTKEEVCDFMVQAGSRAEKSCVVYTGDHTNIVAQMHKEITLRCCVLTGEDNYSVPVHPNVDHAFIVALIVILDDMSRPS